MKSGAVVRANVETASELIRDAAQGGAKLVCLPEYFAFCGPEEEWKRVAREETPKVIEQMGNLADELRVYISLGSVLEDAPDSEKCANTSVILDPRGKVVARYRKIHLFDADLPDAKHRESRYVIAGRKPAACSVDDWTIGMSVCFDLRFPMHYQELRRMGAELILAPSAFTEATGKAHWEPLLRARAIETQCYAAAAAQCGEVAAGRICHGHSMIVGPWGEILGCIAEGCGVILADLDKDTLRDIRRRIPMEF